MNILSCTLYIAHSRMVRKSTTDWKLFQRVTHVSNGRGGCRHRYCERTSGRNWEHSVFSTTKRSRWEKRESERLRMCTLRVSVRACMCSCMGIRNARDKNLCMGLLNKGRASCYCYCCAAAAAYSYPSTSIRWFWWEFACIACVDFLDFMAYSCYILHTQLNERKRKNGACESKSESGSRPCTCMKRTKATKWIARASLHVYVSALVPERGRASETFAVCVRIHWKREWTRMRAIFDCRFFCYQSRLMALVKLLWSWLNHFTYIEYSISRFAWFW